MADRKSKKRRPALSRATSAAVDQASVATRTQRPSPGLMWDSSRASPRCSPKTARRPSRRSSRATSGADSSLGASVVVGSLNGDRLPALLALPPDSHVLVLDHLLEHDDAVDQRLGPGWATGDVHVDGHDLVDALGHGVAVPVRAAAVRAAAHRDDVLRVGHLLVEPA